MITPTRRKRLGISGSRWGNMAKQARSRILAISGNRMWPVGLPKLHGRVPEVPWGKAGSASNWCQKKLPSWCENWRKELALCADLLNAPACNIEVSGLALDADEAPSLLQSGNAGGAASHERIGNQFAR